MMNYDETVDYLNDQKHFNVKPGLDTIRLLLMMTGDPHRGMKYIHIAGTNGKGSTASYIDSILRTAGYRTGLFTSPYVDHFTEKIRVGGEEIAPEDLIRITEGVKEAVSRLEDQEIYPTPFEIQTAVAFRYFHDRQCDIVILEVGLGGRLDSTNIIDESEVSVITALGLDHTGILGDSLEEIAAEKAGIIKPGGRVVTVPQKEGAARVIRQKCLETGADLTVVDMESVRVLQTDLMDQVFEDGRGRRYTIHLQGPHQIENAMAAVTAVDLLVKRGWAISEEDLKKGLELTRWMGRMEILRKDPVLIIDGAHNPQGVEALKKGLIQLFPEKKIVFATGVLADKEYMVMMRTMEPIAEKFLTLTPDSPRALPAEELAGILREDGYEAEACRNAGDLVRHIDRMPPDTVVCAFGSLYMIGEIREAVLYKSIV